MLIKQLAKTLAQARGHAARGESAPAEQAYRQALAIEGDNREALESLVMLCLQSGRPEEAESLLRQLVGAYPAEPRYCDRLATLLRHRGRGRDAIACYRRLLRTRPESNNSRYNLAHLLKLEGLVQEALEEYRICLDRGIERPEEVLSNMSVILTGLHRHGEARKALEAALEHGPGHLPALFNLGLLHEEEGDWPAASGCFRQILQVDPQHTAALCHLANGERIEDHADPLVGRMQQALNQPRLTPAGREELLYALAKAHDDAGCHAEAFDYCAQANRLSAARCGPYDREGTEHTVDTLITGCNSAWLASIAPVSEEPVVFICGMFRSGTTLLEQVLGAHPALTAGGEIDFFQRGIKPFPGFILQADTVQLAAIGSGYIDYLAQHFPGQQRVTNKRPDNFFLLGLLAALYPNARIINTLRQPLDNCLSLFFQPLDGSQPYANALPDTGHFYLLYRRLMLHWRELLGDRVLDVRYEALVDQPQETLVSVLAFLGLDWHDDCLQFHRAQNRVRTASVHQVRQPLYTRSRDRWRNYAAQLLELRELLRTQGVSV